MHQVNQQKYYHLWALLIVLLFCEPSIMAQKIVASGSLQQIEYEFRGVNNIQDHPDLVHALAYANHKDVRNIRAIKTFAASYRVEKKDARGFETTLLLQPQKIQGDIGFYHFQFPQLLLPKLSSIKLLMKNGEDFIYVKNAIIANDGENITIKFKHQRFSEKWQILVKASQWMPMFSDDEFVEIWHWMNDYQSAIFLLKEESKLTSPSKGLAAELYKKRWLAIYQYIQNQDFYTRLVIARGQDPDGLAKNIEIRKFVLERELKGLQKSDSADFQLSEIHELVSCYMRPDMELAEIAQRDVGLYSGFSFSFNKPAVFCYDELNASLAKYSLEERKQFELYDQKLNMELIEKDISDRTPRQALVQIERFESFSRQSQFLRQSVIFQHFKSRAVYDIYLAYIQVARQAIDAGRIEMAMSYLDQATAIQQKYPKEIINDIYVEKELQKLLKKALERYQLLRENGDIDSADQVKKGIQGMLKRYGLNGKFSALKSS
jgi:hypothetical protein